MKILLKCPSRSRPKQLLETLSKYVTMASRPDLMGVVISCDVDDTTMTNEVVQRQVFQVIDKFAWKALYYGENKTKIEACNADIEKVDYPWDLVVLVSDDMIPEIHGYDDIIRKSAPSLDCILWFNDGYQGYKLNTLSIYGREMYRRLGSMYAREYKSFYCDTELTDLCKGVEKSKTVYNPLCIIRHRHPALGYGGADSLYLRNQKYFEQDLRTYISRKVYSCDLSILIPTLVERLPQFTALVLSLREQFARICPGLRLEINELRDNRQMSVGMKRRLLLERATGKYVAFVDDDDSVTDAYFEDFLSCFTSGHDVMMIRGDMGGHTFVHSIRYPLTGSMYIDNMFVRPPNHLNPMLTEFARLATFEDATRGEDLKWTIDLAKTGILKHETPSTRVQYLYTINVAVDPRVIEYQKTHTYDEWVKALLVPAKPARTGLRLSSRGFVSK